MWKWYEKSFVAMSDLIGKRITSVLYTSLSIEHFLPWPDARGESWMIWADLRSYEHFVWGCANWLILIKIVIIKNIFKVV